MSAFPRIDVPVYEIKLPSGKKISFRPFTVKEKKLFLLVRESQDLKDVIRATEQVLQSCIVKPADIDVSKLGFVDMEYFFAHIYSRSAGEIVEIDFECQNTLPPPADDLEAPPTKCGHVSKMGFNLLEAKVESPEGHSNKIFLTPTIGVIMKYPTFAMAELLNREGTPESVVFDIAIDCIESVFDSDKLYHAKDEKREDLVAWFETLPHKSLEKVAEFFKTMPQLTQTKDFKCDKCGYTEAVKLKGLQDFFG
jgi:hypothetical protein